jgi:transcriptional regulator with XRE-family HTH domain
MKILIGENIKRLRKEQGITQEQLANLLNVSCAAISKWENGDTYPDMTMIFPLCHYFKISVDELMGYDASIIENDIKKQLEEYHKLCADCKYSEANAFIKKVYQKYPNNYEIIDTYLSSLTGGLADNDPKVLQKNADEITRLCDTILAGATDERIRLDAITFKAKLLHAMGKTNEALTLLSSFPSFYHASGQRIEQLYAKDTKEFYQQLTLNMYELADFTANKLAKSIFYNQNLTKEEKKTKVYKIGKTFSKYDKDQDFAVFILFGLMFWGESRGKAVLFEYDSDFIIDICFEAYQLADKIATIVQDNYFLKQYLDTNKVITTENNFLHNYIDVTEKYLPLPIKQSSKYQELVKQFQ